MRIHLFGASGSGVTTLGQALATRLSIPYFDTDDYYWMATDPPFQTKQPPAERDDSLKVSLSRHTSWILGGSLDSWGDEWQSAFDVVVYLWLPTQTRIERLRRREVERYGPLVLDDPQRRQQFEAFIAWSAEYDSGFLTGRSKPRHEAWMHRLTCPVIRLEGDFTVKEREDAVLKALRNQP